jgi:hypothetical protein
MITMSVLRISVQIVLVGIRQLLLHGDATIMEELATPKLEIVIILLGQNVILVFQRLSVVLLQAISCRKIPNVQHLVNVAMERATSIQYTMSVMPLGSATN